MTTRYELNDDESLLQTDDISGLLSRKIQDLDRTNREIEIEYSKVVGRIVKEEYRSTISSLRHSRKPRTVSHALIFRDDQSVEELEARLGEASPDLANVLIALEAFGVIRCEISDGVPRYRLVQPEESQRSMDPS
jgi:hypothetical protein